jgi:DNA helicase-4
LSVQKLSDEEIWERLQDRAVDEFSKLATAFVGRVRQNSYSPAQLKDLVRGHEFAFPFEEDFLNIMQQIYGGYIQRIAETGEDDFSGLMERAAKKLKSGNYEFYKKNYTGNIRALKFLMIDFIHAYLQSRKQITK